MTERDDFEYGGLWNGLSYIVLGLLAMTVFVFYGDPVNAVGSLRVSYLWGLESLLYSPQKFHRDLPK